MTDTPEHDETSGKGNSTYQRMIRSLSPTLADKVWCPDGAQHVWTRHTFSLRKHCARCGRRYA